MRPTLLLRYRIRLGGARLIPERLDLHPRLPPATHHVERTVECNVSDFGPFGSEPFDSVFPLQGWETVDTVLAWIAFGSAIPEPEWDRAIYFGASEWCDSHPSLISQLVNFWAVDTENTSDLCPLLRFHLVHSLYGDLMPATRMQELDMLAAAAKSKAEAPTFRAEMACAETKYEAIRAAAEDLRQALARAELAIFGRRGESETSVDRVATARERIPSEVFRAPVTVSCKGVLPVVRDHDLSDNYKVLFSDLLLDAGEVLQIWPDRRQPPEHEHALGKEKPAYPRAKLDAWYENRVRSWPDGEPEPTEADDLEAARQEMRTAISRDAIRALRKRLAPPAWLKSGPRKSRG